MSSPEDAAGEVPDFLRGGGEMGALMRAHDWSKSSLGAPAKWSQALRTVVRLMLNTGHPMYIWWGNDGACLYNDAYRQLIGPERHPSSLGRPAWEVWAEIWDIIGPQIEHVRSGRGATWHEDHLVPITRHGRREDVYWTYSYSPIDDETTPGGIGGVLVVCTETTPKALVAGTLELSEARLRAIFENSYLFQGVLTPEGILLDANSTSLRAIDRMPVDVIGSCYWETPWFSATPGMGDYMRSAIPIAASGEIVHQEIRLDLPVGGWRWFDFVLRPMHDAQGTVVAVISEAMELTARKQAEEALVQAQKMEAVGQLTGGIAHDFNNLLAGISGSLELLERRIAENRLGGIDRYISGAQDAARRAAALTQRLLAFSRRQTLDARPTAVNRLIAGMEELIRRTVGPDVAVEVVGAGGLWLTKVDPSQLENALLNLCINARDAMAPDGGRLTIETANKWLDEHAARERELPLGQYVSLCVSDTGTGMTPEVVARAFDPFYTTKPIGQGTGLGLSMVYGFVRQSGGQVRIYSEVGTGTTVCLYLPRHMGSAVPANEPAREESQMAEAGETVLVIDDEPSIRMLIKDVLEDVGYETIEAADGAAGLAILQSNARVDLLITDVGLPNGMNGRQLADAARITRPGLKVLFITGYAENAVIGSGRLEPGMEIVTKPFVIAALGNKVRQMIEG